MIRVTCDGCGKDGASHKVGFKCHLMLSLANNQYVDNDGNPVSGRTVELDLCNACYNEAASLAVMAIRAIRKRNGIEGGIAVVMRAKPV